MSALNCYDHLLYIFILFLNTGLDWSIANHFLVYLIIIISLFITTLILLYNRNPIFSVSSLYASSKRTCFPYRDVSLLLKPYRRQRTLPYSCGRPRWLRLLKSRGFLSPAPTSCGLLFWRLGSSDGMFVMKLNETSCNR